MSMKSDLYDEMEQLCKDAVGNYKVETVNSDDTRIREKKEFSFYTSQLPERKPDIHFCPYVLIVIPDRKGDDDEAENMANVVILVSVANTDPEKNHRIDAELITGFIYDRIFKNRMLGKFTLKPPVYEMTPLNDNSLVATGEINATYNVLTIDDTDVLDAIS